MDLNYNLSIFKDTKEGGEKTLNKNLLKGKIFEKGKTIVQLQKEIGISKTALYRKMNNISYFTSKEIKIIIKILDLTVEEMNEIFFN